MHVAGRCEKPIAHTMVKKRTRSSCGRPRLGVMNPQFDEAVAPAAYAADESAATAENGAEFRRDIEGFSHARTGLRVCRRWLPRARPDAKHTLRGRRRSFRRAADAMTLAVTHQEERLSRDAADRNAPFPCSRCSSRVMLLEPAYTPDMIPSRIEHHTKVSDSRIVSTVL